MREYRVWYKVKRVLYLLPCKDAKEAVWNWVMFNECLKYPAWIEYNKNMEVW